MNHKREKWMTARRWRTLALIVGFGVLLWALHHVDALGLIRRLHGG